MTFERYQNDVTLKQATRDVFAVDATAAYPAGFVQIAGVFAAAFLIVAAVVIFTFQPAASMSATAKPVMSQTTLGAASTKADRAASQPAQLSCEGQTWGAWSADCAAAITGTDHVRNVQFVTVETPTTTVNQTILARYPTAN